MRHGFAYLTPYTLGRGQPSPRGGYLPASLHRLPTTCSGHGRHTNLHPKAYSQCFGRLASHGSIWAVLRRFGNINPMSIDYACRPRLRSRLTLGGLAWPRNPWSFGGQGSHLPYRYSCLHSHSHTLHHSITRRLHRMQDAPLPNNPRPPHKGGPEDHCRGFGGVLEPRYIVGAGPLDQ